MVIIAVIKEEMKKCLKIIQGNTKEEWKEMNQTTQNLKVKGESTKKMQSEANMEMKNLGNPTGTTEGSFTSIMQD